MLELVGSNPSPFVRRIRVLLDQAKIPYKFTVIDIYSPEGNAYLTKLSPVKKIPVIIDQGKVIYDSRIIFNYLSEKYLKTKLSLDEENLMTVIDGCNDAFVNLILLKRSGFDINTDLMFVNRQKERCAETLKYLEGIDLDGLKNKLNYPAVCLFVLLDWVKFRELDNLSKYPNLMKFYGDLKNLEVFEKTKPA